jgi:hypothetical protein
MNVRADTRSVAAELPLDLPEVVQSLRWDDVYAPGRHPLPLLRSLRLPLPLCEVGGQVLGGDAGQVRDGTHSVAPSQHPVLMNDLIAPDSRQRLHRRR